jgi:hypothetical protein
MRQGVLVLIAVFAFILSPAVCLALLEFHPRISVREEYNDNIFLSDKDKESDFITTLIPGISLNWESPSAKLMLDYSLDYTKYKDNSSEDQTKIKDTQRGLAVGELFPGRDFSVDLLQEFSSVVVDERRPSNEQNTTVNSTTRSQSIINPHYRHNFSPTLMSYLDYRFDHLEYTSSQGDDHTGHSGRLELKKLLGPRFETMLGGDIGTVNNKISPDYDRYSAYTGASFIATPRLTLNAVAGHSWLDFKDQDNDETFVGDAMARLLISKEIGVAAGFTQDLGFSTEDGIYRRKVGRFVFGWNLSDGRYVGDSQYAWGNKYPKTGNALLMGRDFGKVQQPISVQTTIYTSKKEYYTVSREDRDSGIVLRGNLLLGEGWRLLAGGQLAEQKFDPESEKVKRYGVNGGLEYSRKIFVVSGNYYFSDYDSDVDGNDYVNNVFYLQLTVQF